VLRSVVPAETNASPCQELVITDEADVLREEGEQHANKPREAGIDVTSVRVAGTVHGFGPWGRAPLLPDLTNDR
jgi:acetyl esterase/lipase